MELLAASYEGVSLLYPSRDKWKTARLGEGNQANPKGHRGASEVAAGWGSGGTESRVIAAVEPWHGNQVVVYTPPKRGVELWDRHVIDDQLRGGHAVAFADLDGERGKELVVGVRDDADDVGEAGRRCGVRVYRCTDGKGAKWDRLMLDPGGVGVEDLTVADLNGDRKPDIIAVGRQTTNVKIYWNQGR